MDTKTPKPLKVLFFNDICAELERIEEEKAARRQWGNWRLDVENLALVLENGSGGFLYDVDLERCGSSAEVLDWIAQVSGKSWATRQSIGDLVAALDCIFHLQGRLCGGGRGRQINATKYPQVRYRVDAAPSQGEST